MNEKEKTYIGDWDRVFWFNDLVEMQLSFESKADSIGRLVQIRKGCGQFGSDVFIIRRQSGKLISFENVSMVKHVGNAQVDICDEDGVDVEYTIKGEYPETGFIIENPQQPQTPGSFVITTTTIHHD